MSFHDVLLPVTVQYGSGSSVSAFNQMIETTGATKTIARASKVLWSLDLLKEIQSQAEYNEIRQFHILRYGRNHTFRVKDWADYQLTEEVQVDDDGSEDFQDYRLTASTFQIHKIYTDVTYRYRRKITKPVSGTITVEVNTGGGYAEHGNYSVDTDTGIVTFNANVPSDTGVPVRVTCEFDVHARFGVDSLPADYAFYQRYNFEGIPIFEVKE